MQLHQNHRVHQHEIGHLPNHAPTHDMVWIPGGSFLVGTDGAAQDDSTSARLVHVEGFWIDRYPVTNELFRAFVAVTGYKTVAERTPNIVPHSDSPSYLGHPGSLVLIPPYTSTPKLDLADWWIYMRGANWRHPQGPHSDLDSLNRHPVVHITYQDAEAFARWAGKSLPTDLQWLYAARSGSPSIVHRPQSWRDDGLWPCATSAVDKSRADGYGLHDMYGNVWQWTRDTYIAPDAEAQLDRRGMPSRARAGIGCTPYRVIRGGSLHGAGTNAVSRWFERMPQRSDVSSFDVGFRCVVPSVETPCRSAIHG